MRTYLDTFPCKLASNAELLRLSPGRLRKRTQASPLSDYIQFDVVATLLILIMCDQRSPAGNFPSSRGARGVASPVSKMKGKGASGQHYLHSYILIYL